MKVYGLKALFAEQKGNIREIRPIWALEEIGADYELILLNPRTREHRHEDFLKINPFGKVPAIQDGDFALFESAAICAYIGDKFGKLIPPPKTAERAIYDQWVFAALATIEPQTVRVFACDYFFEQNEKTAAVREYAVRALPGLLKPLDGHLGRNTHMLGEEFSMADIAVTGSLHFLKHTDLLEPYGNLTRYLKRVHDRPAYKRAFALNAPLAETQGA